MLIVLGLLREDLNCTYVGDLSVEVNWSLDGFLANRTKTSWKSGFKLAVELANLSQDSPMM